MLRQLLPMAAPRVDRFQDDSFAYMVLKINPRRNWQRHVVEVLKSASGISNFQLKRDGIIEVSGTISPTKLMTKLGNAGRRLELLWLQYGQCSSNMFAPDPRSGYYEQFRRYYSHGNGTRFLTHGARNWHSQSSPEHCWVAHGRSRSFPVPAAQLPFTAANPVGQLEMSCCSIL